METVYAKNPNEARWVVFTQKADGSLDRICSYKVSPKKHGYRQIKWPSSYANAPLTDMIKVAV